MSDVVIGIDLGTTNTCVAVMESDGPRILQTREGHNTMPSVVAFVESGGELVGHLAKRQAVTNATNTVGGVKRLIGRRYQSKEVQEALSRLSFSCAEGPHGDVRVVFGDEQLAVPEISSKILLEAKRIAENELGYEVSRAVITVPAYFKDNQRQATRDAGQIAGLEVLRIINEPTAAALAYGFKKGLNQKTVVFDLGGGTFDISILEIGQEVFEVLSTAGDSFLGGEDFDDRIIDWLAKSFEEENGIDLREDKMSLQRLRAAAEQAKIELSEAESSEVNLPFIHSAAKVGALHVQQLLTREVFHDLVDDLIRRALAICRETMEKSGLKASELDAVILVGGMTRVPRITQAVSDFFGLPPTRGVHADEAVAAGAAIQGSLLGAGASETLLLDVTSHDLGIGVAGGLFDTVIPSDTTIPTSATKEFTTAQDGQTQVRILVMQGRSSRGDQNELLGEFLLDGLREAGRGELKIDIKFEISADGMVSVSARDQETGQSQLLTVTASSGLTDEEIREMVDRTKQNLLATVETDAVKSQRANVEERFYKVKARLAGLEERGIGELVGAEPVEKTHEALNRCRDVIDSGDTSRMDETERALNRIDSFLEQMDARVN